MKPVVKLLKLGRLSYRKALAVQQQLFDNLKTTVTGQHYAEFIPQPIPSTGNLPLKSASQSPGNTLILVQHEPVYTIGIRSKLYDSEYVVRLRRQLEEQNLEADFVQTSRGGLITFHGPGQLVAYPILHLGDFGASIKNKSLKNYVHLLESTIIDTLDRVGVQGAHTVTEHPGIWLHGGERKIGFVGIACKRYVTMHGISINCDCDLRWFDFIVSCGIEDKLVTSIQKEIFISGLSERLREQEPAAPEATNSSSSSVDLVSQVFCRSFSDHFECSLVAAEDE